MLLSSLTKRVLCLVLVFFLGTKIAHADVPMTHSPFNDYYVNFSGGAVFTADSDTRGGSNVEMGFDTGFGFSASLGYRPVKKDGSKSHFRFEGEVGYRKAEINTVGTSGSGDIQSGIAMANAFYDLKNASFVTPYFGIGLGFAYVKLEDNALLGAINEADTVPAFQLMTGLSYDPRPEPFATWHLGYRFLSTFSEPSFNNTTTGAESKYEYGSHSVELGLRLNF